MRNPTNVRNRWRRGGLAGALTLGLLFLPAASGSAMAHDDHGRDRGRNGQFDRRHGDDGHWDRRGGQRNGRGLKRGHARYVPAPRHVHAVPVAYGPVWAPYYRPRVAPVFYALPSAQVIFHGPSIAAQVVAYPAGGVPVYEPGYCPVGGHYHPYYPEKGVHGSLSIRIGF